VVLARTYGCPVTCVDFHEPFLDHARRRAAEAGVAHLVTLIHEDAAEFMQHAQRYGMAMCLGAAGVLGGFEAAATALRGAVPTGGHVVIGDLYRREGVALDAGDDPPQWLTDALSSAALVELLDGMVRSGLARVSVLPSSEEDWMTYSSLIWLSIEDWLDENPAHPDAASKRGRSYSSDLLQQRLGWALIAGRRTRDLEESAKL
jgi:hypothetical protein